MLLYGNLYWPSSFALFLASFYIRTDGTVREGGICASPNFGRSVNHIPTRGSRLCPPHYYPLPQIFRPSAGSVLCWDHGQPLLLDVPREWSMFTHKWPPLAGRRRHAICGLFSAPAKSGSKHGLFPWLSAAGVRLPEVVVLVTAVVVVHTHHIHTAIIF